MDKLMKLQEGTVRAMLMWYEYDKQIAGFNLKDACVIIFTFIEIIILQPHTRICTARVL
jgi:hypothetical protein